MFIGLFAAVAGGIAVHAYSRGKYVIAAIWVATWTVAMLNAVFQIVHGR